MSAHSGACGRSSLAPARVSGGMPPRHGVQVFSTSVSVMASSVNQHDHSRPAPSLPHQAPASAQRTTETRRTSALDQLENTIGGERALSYRFPSDPAGSGAAGRSATKDDGGRG